MFTPELPAAVVAAPARYAFADTSLGLVGVAVAGDGVRALVFGGDRATIRDDLAGRVPDAPLVADAGGLCATMAAAAALIEDPRRSFDIALAPRGSAFEQAVWRALRDVPAGETVSYGDLAARIGTPGKAYQVGAACAANPIAVAIPCHRVVRKDGGLAGYRWGVGRKRALLARERAPALREAA